jgi:hypothetical protein
MALPWPSFAQAKCEYWPLHALITADINLSFPTADDANCGDVSAHGPA